jgi:hypothetical protein
MNILKMVMKKTVCLLFLVMAFSAVRLVGAQCCCSGVSFSIMDKYGSPLTAEKVSVTETTKRSVNSSGRLYFGKGIVGSSMLDFQIGCGKGDETISLKYKDREMRIRFKFLGEFGRAYGQLVFVKGDFIAEPVANGEKMGIRIRKAEREEIN